MVNSFLVLVFITFVKVVFSKIPKMTVLLMYRGRSNATLLDSRGVNLLFLHTTAAYVGIRSMMDAINIFLSHKSSMLVLPMWGY